MEPYLYNPPRRKLRPKPKRPVKAVLRWLFRWLTRIVIAVCIVTALLMLSLRWVNPSTSGYMVRYEQAAKRKPKHEWVDFDQVAWSLPLAVMAAEDQRFPQHWGLDLHQIRLALQANAKRRNPRGASTISQQTIKNLFLWPGRSYIRKALEAWLTLWMELLVPKKRILEIYINIAQFGKSVFGVQAASSHYFGKKASDLNARESRLLAASLPTPSSSNPAKPSAYLQKRDRILRKQMEQLGGYELIKSL